MRGSGFSDVACFVVLACWGMPRYRREHVPGGTFFFTVNLLERRRRLLVDHVDELRASFRAARHAQPIEVIAIVILPDHLHCLWRLPEGDGDNAGPWARIKPGFCRRLPAVEYRSAVRIARRERGVATTLLGTSCARRDRSSPSRRLHSHQSGQAWACGCGV